MLWNKKTHAQPLGVALHDVLAILQSTSLRPRIEGNVLLAHHDDAVTRVEVLPPEQRDSENGPIQAVVRIVTELSPGAQRIAIQADVRVALNAVASLGALWRDGSRVSVGSRLTIYEGEDAWRSLHLPLIAFAAIAGAGHILGGIGAGLAGARQASEAGSAWTRRDLALVERHLSQICLCTGGGSGITAEFGLGGDAVSAVRGDHTALFQLFTDQPHPSAGGGLFCLLQLPNQIADEGRLTQVCDQLNRMEMAAHDLPPHFGAWCAGRMGTSPAYVSFLPNALHSVGGIAANVSIWALVRARWASAMLASLGVTA